MLTHAQDIQYNIHNKPTIIKDFIGNSTVVGVQVEFEYGPHQQRIYMKLGNRHFIYGEDYEAEVDANGNKLREWTYISGPYGLVAVNIAGSAVTNPGLYYAHTDHLGSVLLLTNASGAIQEKYNYDAWGKRRDPVTLAPLTANTGLLRRVFTFHEHIDEVGLINMNGRLYDPALGRFLNADPFIQQPSNPQNFNRYSYVLNNPMKYTDPSGYFFGTILAYVSDFIETTFFKGGLDVTSGKSFEKAWSSFDPTASWSKTNHGFKIDMGWFQTDSKRTWVENYFKIISRFTWELPQNVAGSFYSHGRNITGNVDRVDYFGGATFVTGENQKQSQGVSLGNYINIDITDNIEGGFQERVLQDPLFMHEYGHTFDSQIYGLSYLPVIGLQSIFSAWRSKQVDGEPDGVYTHDFFWTETRANRHAKSYFKRYGVDWNSTTVFTDGLPIETLYPTNKR